MDVARITPNHELVMSDDFIGHTILIPSIHLSFFKLSLPAKSIAQCQRIIAFSLEEELAQDISDLHYAVQRSGEQWFVVVCSHEKIRQWLDLCIEHGINPKKFIPDVLVLPEESNFLIEPDQCLINSPDKLPVAIHPNIIEDVANLLPEEDIPAPFIAENYGELLESDINISSSIINLLQNEYNKSTPYKTLLQPWLKVAAWGGVLWLSLSAYYYLENQQIESSINKTRQANIQKFKGLFPEEKRIVNLRTQAEQKFRKINQQKQFYSVNFIGLTEAVITALDNSKKINLTQVNYNNYALRIYVKSNSVAGIQDFINKLKENKTLDINVQSLGDSDGKAKSTISIKKIT